MKRGGTVDSSIQSMTSNKQSKLRNAAGSEPLPPPPKLDCAQEHDSHLPPRLGAQRPRGTQLSVLLIGKPGLTHCTIQFFKTWRGLVWILKVENVDPERRHLLARIGDVALRNWLPFLTLQLTCWVNLGYPLLSLGFPQHKKSGKTKSNNLSGVVWRGPNWCFKPHGPRTVCVLYVIIH